mmetsp:Transcript_2644/g.2971  ORF Transcript_2644/g.2971 Transcript_2644/m.2971 type:complete len:215 (-) Transcript_2644:704-1348(-)
MHLLLATLSPLCCMTTSCTCWEVMEMLLTALCGTTTSQRASGTARLHGEAHACLHVRTTPCACTVTSSMCLEEGKEASPMLTCGHMMLATMHGLWLMRALAQLLASVTLPLCTRTLCTSLEGLSSTRVQPLSFGDMTLGMEAGLTSLPSMLPAHPPASATPSQSRVTQCLCTVVLPWAVFWMTLGGMISTTTCGARLLLAATLAPALSAASWQR